VTGAAVYLQIACGVIALPLLLLGLWDMVRGIDPLPGDDFLLIRGFKRLAIGGILSMFSWAEWLS